jgi:hypothetical protein
MKTRGDGLLAFFPFASGIAGGPQVLAALRASVTFRTRSGTSFHSFSTGLGERHREGSLPT